MVNARFRYGLVTADRQGTGRDGGTMATNGALLETLPVPLVEVIQRSRIVVVAVVAFIVFVPTWLSFWQNVDLASVADWVVLIASTALLAGVLMAQGRRHYIPLVFTGSFVLLAAPLLPVPFAAPWIPVLNIAVAVCGGAALAMKPIPAGVVVITSSGLIALSSQRTPPSEALGNIPVLVPVTLSLLCGIAFILFMEAVRHSAASLDGRATALREAGAAEGRILAESHERATVERRIHETVLNTLQALAMGIAPQDESRTRQTCQRDLEILDVGGRRQSAMHARDVIDLARQEFLDTDLDFTIEVTTSQELEGRTASALRDAIVEALRNVQRHARVDAVVLTAWGEDDQVHLQIRDKGVGFTGVTGQGFGVDRAIVSGIRGVGGRASVTSDVRGGTCVSITVPAKADNAIPITSGVNPIADESLSNAPRAVVILSESGWARLGLILVPCVLIPWSTWIGDAVASTLAVRVLCGFFVASVAILGLAWDTQARVPLALLSLASTSALLGVVASTNPTCDAEVPTQALIAAATGVGLFLPVVALPSTTARLLCVGIVLAMSLLVVLALPGGCRTPMRSAIDAAIYLLAWTLAIAWIERLFAARQRDADATWVRILADQHAVAEEQARIAAWAVVDGETRDLLACVAAGSASIVDVRDQARLAATRTRDRLLEGGLRRTLPESITGVLEGLAHPPRIVVLGSGEGAGPMPVRWADYLRALLASSSSGSGGSWRATIDGRREQHVIVVPGSMYSDDVPMAANDNDMWQFSVVVTEQVTSVLVNASHSQ